MLSLELLVFALTVFAAPAVATPHNVRRHPLLPREYVTPDTLAKSYDYIIAGGGIGGLVMASKLSADGKTTVLVLEAGQDGNDLHGQIDPPGMTYFNGLFFGPHDWLYGTVPQTNANDRVMMWPRGKILGGSSTSNGMYIVRPHEKEINAIHDMIATKDNKAYADSWTWDSMFESMKASETFHPPTEEALAVAGMKYNEASHGKSGRLQTTYSGYQVPIVSAWLPTLEAAGIETLPDAYAGNNAGAFISQLAINPSNWTRSYAKSAYIDPVEPRSNLHIMCNSYVTKITFSNKKVDGGLVATGVEFAATRDATPTAVLADKEVIVAGGAVGSPHMLLVSGVGPKAVLEAANIPVVVDLPGVGEHLQDHLATGVDFETEQDTQGDIFMSESDFAKSAEFLSFVNAATSYIKGNILFEDEANFQTFLDGLTATLNDDAALAPLLPGSDSEVNAGYKAIYKTLIEKVYPEAGLLEMLYSINAPGIIKVQAAIQTPLSQGRLWVNSTSIFDPPILDPKYYSHPGDIVIMRQGLKLVRKLATLAPFKDLITREVKPGPEVVTDEQIDAWIKTNSDTEFHPGCTCAMLPKEQGGVIDASLKVYGTSNVRVVDGSVFPLSMSAHLMAPIYGLAEKAADLITNPPKTGSDGTKTSTGKDSSATGKTGDKDADKDGDKDGNDGDDDSSASALSVVTGLAFTAVGAIFTLFAL